MFHMKHNDKKETFHILHKFSTIVEKAENLLVSKTCMCFT